MELNEHEIEQKIIEHMGLIKTMANRVYLKGYATEDIEQEIAMVFVKALKNYKEDKGVLLTTLFFTYYKRWLTRKLEFQNAYKRPNVSESLDKRVKKNKVVKNTEPELYLDIIIDENEITPDKFQRQEDLQMAIIDFTNEDKDGDILFMSLFQDKTLTEIANVRGCSAEWVRIKKNEAMKRLRLELIEKDYLNEEGALNIDI